MILDVEIPDDGTDDPYDFKFVRWLTKNKVWEKCFKRAKIFIYRTLNIKVIQQ